MLFRIIKFLFYYNTLKPNIFFQTYCSVVDALHNFENWKINIAPLLQLQGIPVSLTNESFLKSVLKSVDSTNRTQQVCFVKLAKSFLREAIKL